MGLGLLAKLLEAIDTERTVRTNDAMRESMRPQRDPASARIYHSKRKAPALQNSARV